MSVFPVLSTRIWQNENLKKKIRKSAVKKWVDTTEILLYIILTVLFYMRVIAIIKRTVDLEYFQINMPSN